MSSIGGTSCDFVRGSLPVLKMRNRMWSVPGLNGYGAMILGSGDSQARITCVGFGTKAAVNVWAAALYAMQGTIVTVVNDHGDTVANCFLNKVSNVAKTPARRPGTTTTTRGEVEITLTRLS